MRRNCKRYCGFRDVSTIGVSVDCGLIPHRVSEPYDCDLRPGWVAEYIKDMRREIEDACRKMRRAQELLDEMLQEAAREGTE